jgi:undecaprenol kinase
MNGLAVVFAIGIVIVAEMLNTAIEKLTDMVSPEINPKAKVVKDLAAGSVLMASITAAVIGLIVFLPKVV